MRHVGKLALLGALVVTSGCHRERYVAPVIEMPPNTILLSAMMKELNEEPGFSDELITQLDKSGKKGPALLTPRLLDDFHKRVLGQYWVGLDRFPGWTMKEINPVAKLAGEFATYNSTVSNLAAVHPGASPDTAKPHEYLDLGPYTLEQSTPISLEAPSTLPGFTTQGIVTVVGNGVVRGDGPNELAPEHAESQRLADVLNRLSANGLDGVTKTTAVWSAGREAATPQELIQAIMDSGHAVSVTDSRYFANFGHIHYKGQDVMMPFWVNTQILIPRSGGRPLMVPVSHAEYEWHIRGPRLNADVSYYFGVDGKAQWRTMDTLDQGWVLKRNAHTYSGQQALEVTRLAGLMTVAYMRMHEAHPALPFGGYYSLGVCQDGVSAIEKHLTGKVTLFPNTSDPAFFIDPRDAEINTLFRAIPKDRYDAEPEPERIFGSLPADPGVKAEFSTIAIPGLAADLHAVHVAWTKGSLHRLQSRLHTAFNIALWVTFGLIAVGGTAILIVRNRNIRLEQEQP